MSFRYGWDHAALAALRRMKQLPLPDDLQLGESIVHRPTSEWYTFGELHGSSAIVIDSKGEAKILPADECYAAWNPQRDPQVYEALLKEERSRSAKRSKAKREHE